MKTRPLLGWLLGGAVLAWLLSNRQTVTSTAADLGDTVTATLAGWKTVQQGPVWIPVINTSEQQFGLPTDLLARMAYQESHFRPEIINGSTISRAGALGILQLMPQFFKSVNAPRPFSQSDTVAQISEAAQYLQSLYNQFQDWGLAVAAYNDGPGNIRQYLSGLRNIPDETLTYVKNVLADVPLPTVFNV